MIHENVTGERKKGSDGKSLSLSPRDKEEDIIQKIKECPVILMNKQIMGLGLRKKYNRPSADK